MPIVRSASEKLMVRLLKAASSPADITAARIFHMIYSWLRSSCNVSGEIGKSLLKFCLNVTLAHPQMMPLFFKTHLLLESYTADKILSDAALLQQMYDQVLKELKAGKTQLILLLSHICQRGAKPAEDLWNRLDVTIMQASSSGRSGHFAKVSSPASQPTGIQLDSLPDDVFAEIIQRCHYDTDIGALSSTCKALNAKISALTHTAWAKIFRRFNMVSSSDSKKAKGGFISEVSHPRAFRKGWDLQTVRRVSFDQGEASADATLTALPNREIRIAVRWEAVESP
eukprot:TRINITY_DN10296_c0_g1_i1.p1 TRINITY_DN10296_c0_g1~~TRINITY_DN10296_c0_g1_i1.p1  ORF type:complete len:284 (+),score=39.52 TRINITY_DN10296_c0_g1_i1:413-1264(+)